MSGALSYPAPAKLNLMLRVVGRRADGYHLLQTVFRFIDYADTVTLRVRDDGVPSPLAGNVEHVARRAEFTPRYLFSDRERPHLVMRVKIRIDDPKAELHAGVPVLVTLDRNSPRSAAPSSVKAP